MSAAQISALQNVRQKAGWKCFRARPYARVNFNKFQKQSQGKQNGSHIA